MIACWSDNRLPEEHWTRGGTGITNFGREELWRYLIAIEEHGDPALFVRLRPMAGDTLPLFSLHFLNAKTETLDAFWGCFERIKTPPDISIVGLTRARPA